MTILKDICILMDEKENPELHISERIFAKRMIQNNSLEYIGCLLSLLEEKDKALEKISEALHYSKAVMIARNALNTTSTREE